MKKFPNSCEECLDRATLYWGFVTMDCSKCPRIIDAGTKGVDYD